MNRITAVSFFLILNILFFQTLEAQEKMHGVIYDSDSKEKLEYVSIGVIGHDVGTVSSSTGDYSLSPDYQYDNDSIRFSCIGYEAVVVNVKDFRTKASKDIYLKRKETNLKEVVVVPKIFKEKILGNTFDGKVMAGGFSSNQEGYEVGVLLKIKKSALLEKLTFNTAYCSYDSIFYRINIYKVIGKNEFENILDQPIYLSKKINKSATSVSLDLSPYNLVVEGNTLVTIEHIKDMGEGTVALSGNLFKGAACYYRKTSQGVWKKTPLQLGINVKAKVEQ